VGSRKWGTTVCSITDIGESKRNLTANDPKKTCQAGISNGARKRKDSMENDGEFYTISMSIANVMLIRDGRNPNIKKDSTFSNHSINTVSTMPS